MAPSKILQDHNRELAIVTPEVLHLVEEDLRSERERTLSEAWDSGYADGLEQARTDAAREAEHARATIDLAQLALTEASKSAIGAFELEHRRLQREAVELAFVLTETVLVRELQLSDSPGMEAIARAVAEVPSGAAMTVRLNPADVRTIDVSSRPEDAPKIVADAAIGQGGCLLEVGTTVVDARIEAALGRIRQVFDEVTGGD
jgi:flagellar biosynthesis/type III secretory pathway protein FliH